MKRVGLATTLFLFTVSLGIYSRSIPIPSISWRNHTKTVFQASPNGIQQGLQRSLDKVLDNYKSNPLPQMTKDAE